ncbi:hypothetical protein JCM8097_005364 [Rhodosporidiobolus ruineniae]
MTDSVPAAAANAPVCCVCGAQPAQRCSRCHPHRSSYYCSAACQKLVWSYHKQVCGKDEPYFPFPTLDSKDREYIKRTAEGPSMPCRGMPLAQLVRQVLPPAPEESLPYLIDDFLDGKKHVVEKSEPVEMQKWLIDATPAFPLLGWFYAHLFINKNMSLSPSQYNPFAVVGWALHHVVSTAQSPMFSDDRVPLEALRIQIKPFLDAIFDLAVLIPVWRGPKRPKDKKVDAFLGRAFRRAMNEMRDLPLSKKMQLWLESSLDYNFNQLLDPLYDEEEGVEYH